MHEEIEVTLIFAVTTEFTEERLGHGRYSFSTHPPSETIKKAVSGIHHMKLMLNKNARIKKKPTIIEGFPGFGLVGTIATEFLIEHLQTEIVGEFTHDELPATVAIHNGKAIKPMAIHYNRTKNILILHTMLSVKGFEWQTAREIVSFMKKTDAKELICLEGVNAMIPQEETKLYSYGNKAFTALGTEPMNESIIMGVTAALLTMINVSCLFAETHSGLPDSKAAAALIGVLDKHLGLHVDPKPLAAQAVAFEQKLKNIMEQTSKTKSESDKKNLSYLG